MNSRDIQNAFGPTPASFRADIDDMLNRLEENEMKKRKKFSVTLIAAALIALLIAGAALATNGFRLFDIMNTANPIVPLEGAEKLIKTSLGEASGTYATLRIEEAAYDGHGAQILLHLIPADTEKYVLFNDMLEETLSDELWVNETVIDEDGVSFYTAGSRDGRTLLRYSLGIDDEEELSIIDTFDAEKQSDGSVLIWAEGFTANELNDSLSMLAHVRLWVDDKLVETLEIPFTLTYSDGRRCASLQITDAPAYERFAFLSGEMTFTDVRGYVTVCYSYEPTNDEPMGITFQLYDENGNRIPDGSGTCRGLSDENGQTYYEEYFEIQSFAQMPETLTMRAKVIGDDRYIAEFTVNVVPK